MIIKSANADIHTDANTVHAANLCDRTLIIGFIWNLNMIKNNT